jgi:catechol 2,3-dioxygenase-like lactoylglutathione lyase family enzyme
MPKPIGINHVALEVGDVDAALEWYGAFLELTLRGRVPGMAFVDLGDQFLALAEGPGARHDDERHFGLVVDDKEATRAAMAAAGLDVAPSGGLRARDPWGNVVEIVGYRDVQFTKTPAVLRAQAAEGLEKSPEALRELREKGIVD